MNLVLDTGVVGQLVHPNQRRYRPVIVWLETLLDDFRDSVQVFLPEIADYELRRKLLHLLAKKQTSPKSIDRLNDLSVLLDYLPLQTDVLRHAAQLWADARSVGAPTAPDAALDGDGIIAAQAIEVAGIIATTNRKHLSRFVPCKEWTEIQSEMASW
jgi:predicted nucleic acid-binding protein